jgi:uncharacterized phage-associated protein
LRAEEAVRFFFNIRKASQAAAYLVKLHGGQMNLMSLLKLLYLADRASLVETGYSITGDQMVSMPHGPVLSRIYDFVKWGKPESEQDESAQWYEYITERNNHEVSLAKASPSFDELSEYERDVLKKVHDEYGHLKPWELRDLTHNLPEYKDPNGSSIPISPVEILRIEGKGNDEIGKIVRTAAELVFLEELTDDRLSQKVT